MEMNTPVSPRAKVVGNKDLVGEILERSGSSLDMIRCSAVSSTWLAAKKTPFVARGFCERNIPASLGFMVELVVPPGLVERHLRLVYPHPSQGDASAAALRPHVDAAVLEGDVVLSSQDGIVLTRGTEFGANPDYYFTSTPTESPRVYTLVADLVPPIPHDVPQFTRNTFGQFAVVPEAGNSGMAFFIKDAAPGFFCCYDGVSFCSNETIFFHVCIFNGVFWDRRFSPPYPVPESQTALFHRNPYCIIAGRKLYMMYVVQFIVCMDLDNFQFTKIPLPSDLSVRIRSWYDYTVAPHTDGGIAVVYYLHGYIHKWVLHHDHDNISWDMKPSKNLVEMFGSRIPDCIWTRVFRREVFDLGSDPYWSMQVRTASPNAHFVLLTLTFDRDNLYEVDLVRKTVREIPKPVPNALIGHIFALSEPWPLKP